MTSSIILVPESGSAHCSLIKTLPYNVSELGRRPSAWSFNIENEYGDLFSGGAALGLTIHKSSIARFMAITLPSTRSLSHTITPDVDVIHTAVSIGRNLISRRSVYPDLDAIDIIQMHCEHHSQLERWTELLRNEYPQHNLVYRFFSLNMAGLPLNGRILIEPLTCA